MSSSSNLNTSLEQARSRWIAEMARKQTEEDRLLWEEFNSKTRQLLKRAKDSRWDQLTNQEQVDEACSIISLSVCEIWT